jgi:hypothetical protein
MSESGRVIVVIGVKPKALISILFIFSPILIDDKLEQYAKAFVPSVITES